MFKGGVQRIFFKEQSPLLIVTSFNVRELILYSTQVIYTIPECEGIDPLFDASDIHYTRVCRLPC